MPDNLCYLQSGFSAIKMCATSRWTTQIGFLSLGLWFSWYRLSLPLVFKTFVTAPHHFAARSYAFFFLSDVLRDRVDNSVFECQKIFVGARIDVERHFALYTVVDKRHGRISANKAFAEFEQSLVLKRFRKLHTVQASVSRSVRRGVNHECVACGNPVVSADVNERVDDVP